MPSQPLFPPLLLLPLGQLFASGVESQEGRGRLCALRSWSQEIGAGTPRPPPGVYREHKDALHRAAC